MNNNEILNQLMQILLPILATFLTGVFTYIGNRLKKIYEEKINNTTAKEVVDDAVRFVEQVYTDLSGREKLEMATKQVSEVLQSKGIKITQAEINMLIESAVYGLNEGWFDKKENQKLLQELQVLASNIQTQQASNEITDEEKPLPEVQQNYDEDNDILEIL